MQSKTSDFFLCPSISVIIKTVAPVSLRVAQVTYACSTEHSSRAVSRLNGLRSHYKNTFCERA